MVSSETLAEYLPRVESLARRFNKAGGAEFDDLVQEGLLKVFLLLRDEKLVSNTAIKNAMRDWVRFCFRKGFAEPMPEADLDMKTGVHSAPGKRRTHWVDEDGSMKGGWSNLGHVPDTA